MVETSIIIPVKNRRFLQETLKSVALQTYKDYEIIIVNDDPTFQNFKKFQKISKKIRVIHNNKNIGPALSKAKGVREAKGKFICFLDGDDIIKPEKLEVQLFLMKKKKYKFSFTDYETIDENGRVLFNRIPIRNKTHYKLYLKTRGIVNSTVVVEKKLLTKKILNSTNKYYGEDTLWWLLIMKYSKIFCYKIDQNLTSYRITNDGLSSKKFSYFSNIFKIYFFDLKINIFKCAYLIPRYIFDVIIRKFHSNKTSYEI